MTAAIGEAALTILFQACPLTMLNKELTTIFGDLGFA